MTEKRGIIVSAPTKIHENGVVNIHAILHPQELRFWLLFWDELRLPVNKAIRIEYGEEARLLESAGIVCRHDIAEIEGADEKGIELAPYFSSLYKNAFKEFEKKEPGKWSVAVGENSISFPDAQQTQGRSILVSLHRAIPVPDKDVPLQDILEFRHKRNDELAALRFHLDDIYQRVLSAGDGELAISSEIDRLRRSIEAHMKTSHESKLKFKIFDFETGITLRDAILPSAGTALLANFGMPILESFGAAVAASLLLKIGPSVKWKKPEPTPFRYVSSFHSEVF